VGTLQVVEAQDQAAWNAAVLRSPRADLLQSWQWGEFKRKSGGWKTTRLLVCDGAEPVAGAQLLARRVMGLPSLYAPRGPWRIASPTGAEGWATLARWLRRRSAFAAPFLRADPLIAESGAGTTSDAIPDANDLATLTRLGFRRAPREVQPRATIVVDLTPDDDKLLAAFNAQVRYNIRHALKKGVEVSEGGLADVAPFYALLAATAERKGFHERDISYFTHLMAAFGDAALISLARYNGEVVYGALVVAFGPTAYYLYGASGGDRSVKPSELGQYRAMLWAKRRGATRYDMWGIPAHPTKDNPLYGVYTFKSGFGGVEERYVGALDLPLMPLVGARLPAMETFALKSLSLARGHGFQLVDHLA